MNPPIALLLLVPLLLARRGSGGSSIGPSGYPNISNLKMKAIQQQLSSLGFNPGPLDGRWAEGDDTFNAVKEFQAAHGLTADGKPGRKTQNKLNALTGTSSDTAAVDPELRGKFNLAVYKPGTAEQIELFEAAAGFLGVPKSWASSDSFIKLLNSESGGRVGIPNWYLTDIFGDDWEAAHRAIQQGKSPAYSNATGLGQLQPSNIDKFYPDGRAGIGDPFNEAVGMLAYINSRWKSPNRAWECYKPNSCFSGVGIDGYGAKDWGGY